MIDAVEKLACAGSMDDIVATVRTTARLIARADGITFVLREGDLCHYVAEDAIAPLWQGQRFPLSACISGWCMQHAETAIIPNIYEDPRIPFDAYRPTFVSSLVMTPVAGVPSPAAIGAYWSEQKTPDPDTVALLAALARSTGIAIANVQLRRSLRDSEAQCARFIEALPTPIYVTDAHGELKYFNQAAVTLLGLKLDPKAPSLRPRITLLTPRGELIPDDQTPMARTLDTGQPEYGTEAIVVRPDAAPVPVLPYATPIRGQDGSLIGAISLFVDITERRTAETAIRTLLDELNHRVKNNLQMLAGLLGLSHRESKHPEAQAAIGRAWGRVSAMSAAQRTLYVADHAISIDMNELLSAVCASAGAETQTRIHCSVERSAVHADSAMPLSLIVNELVTNALKHACPDARDARINVSLRADQADLVLQVADNGPGFSARKARDRAAGLGLVDALARQLRGSFSVEPGAGARSTVRFPSRAMSHGTEGKCPSAS